MAATSAHMGCVVKEVGHRGTDMLKAAWKPVHERDRCLRLEHGRTLESWNARREAGGKDFNEKDDPEPLLQRVITSDPTIEALTDILRNGGKFSKLALVVDELADCSAASGATTAARAGRNVECSSGPMTAAPSTLTASNAGTCMCRTFLW